MLCSPGWMHMKGRVYCPMKSFLDVLSWSSTTKQTSASSGVWMVKSRVSFHTGLNPEGGGQQRSEYNQLGSTLYPKFVH